MAKFTPGPWLIDGRTVYALNDEGVHNRFTAVVKGGIVSWVYAGGERTAESEIKANAALIAAAPKLLAAGIEAASVIELMLTECDMRGISKRGIDALVQLTEAIQQTETGR